jgi:hypothetical protein
MSLLCWRFHSGADGGRARFGARLKIVASIEDTGVITRILAHRDRASGKARPQRALQSARAPPGKSAV